MPGTPANCLQCLSLCLLGACVLCLCEHTGHARTHADTDGTVKGRDSRRTLHTPVLLLCKWIILFIIISYLCIQIIFPPRLRLSYRTNVAASCLQAPPPRICMKVLRCLQSLVFYVYLSDVRNGGCKCHWLGLCSVWHSKLSVRKLRDPPPQVFKWDIQAHPESDLHPAARFAMGQHVRQQFFKLY